MTSRITELSSSFRTELEKLLPTAGLIAKLWHREKGSGAIYTWLPLSREQCKELDLNHALPGAENHSAQAIGLMSGFDTEMNPLIALKEFSDDIISPIDPGRLVTDGCLVFQDERYAYQRFRGSSPERVITLLEWPNTTTVGIQIPDTEATHSDIQIHSIASVRLTYVYFQAFDGEGAVMWMARR